MALNFVATATSYLLNTTATITATPLSMAAWFFCTASQPATMQRFCSLNDTGAISYWALGRATDGTAQAASRTATAERSTVSSMTSSPNRWNHAGGVFVSSTSRTAWLNGINPGSGAAPNAPSGIDNTVIGAAFAAATATGYFQGMLADVAMWNIALASEDMQMLAKGVSPLMIQPQALVHYWPLIGADSPEIDRAGGFQMTWNGAPVKVADHPRIYRMYRQIVNAFKIAGGTTTQLSAALVSASVVTITRQTGKIAALLATGTLAKTLAIGKALAMQAVGVVTMTLTKVFQVAVTLIATGVLAVTRQTGKVAAATASGVTSTTRAVSKTFAVVATGVVSMTDLFIAGAAAVVEAAKVIGIKVMSKLGIR